MRQTLKLMMISVAISLLVGCGATPQRLDSPAAISAETKSQDTSAPGSEQARNEPAATPAEVMAYVNGKAVPMATLIDTLIRRQGLPLARQFVRSELLRQEMARKGITVTDAEIQAEVERILKLMVPQAVTPRQRRQVLRRLLTQRGITHQQWLGSVRLAVQWRKLIEPSIKVSPEMLREQFSRRFGRQVIVREIVTNSLEKAQRIMDKLKSGKKFAQLAYVRSIGPTARNGGLLKPIGAKTDNVSPAIRQVALSLKKPGDISDPVQVNVSFHILKLEKIIEPENVKFEDVKADMESLVRQKLLQDERKRILRKLIAEAKIEYVNPLLKRLDAQDTQSRQAQGSNP